MVGKGSGKNSEVCGTVDTEPKHSVCPKSMTGFARVSARSETCELEVEIKSVNHRYFEVSIKCPRHYQQFERAMRGVLQRDHRRGKFDLSIVRKSVVAKASDEVTTTQFDARIDEAVGRFSRACKRYGVSGDHLGTFLAQAAISFRGTDDEIEIDPSVEEKVVLDAVNAASVALLRMREEEGANLIEEVSSRLRTVEVCRSMIDEAAKELPQKLHKRLQERVQQLLQESTIDPQRLAMEVALLADRVDITEELARLESHFQQFRGTLHGSPEGVGRKLDFLMQELGREFNTITSKAQDARIQGIVVDVKAELEKIREQVQNIE